MNAQQRSNDSIKTLFDIPIPESATDRARLLARDLALGALKGWWPAEIKTEPDDDGKWGEEFRGKKLEGSAPHAFKERWIPVYPAEPPYPLLAALGYLDVIYRSAHESNVVLKGVTVYNLTEKALKLIEEPDTPTLLFVSYRHCFSSAFALLLEARLRQKGAGVFIDKNIVGGQDWELRIREELKRCSHFLCLITAETFVKKSWVVKELEVLNEVNPTCPIIWVCHNGMKLKKISPNFRHIRERLERFQGYEVLNEKALDYEAAVNFVFNAVGFKTY